MPPISLPPRTWRRFATTSALFLFLLLRTPLHPAAAQPASTPPSDEPPSSTPAYRQLLPPVAQAQARVIVVFVLLFLLSLSSFALRYCLDSEDSIGRAVRSLRRLGGPRGLDPAVIETFPTVVYSAMKGRKIGEASLKCAVCLNDFEDDDTLRLIPKCDHAFHPDCIGAWLASHTTCPVCRADLGSQPAGDSESQEAESGTEPPLVEVTVEAAPPDGSAPERSPREGGGERIQPPDLWDKNELGSFNNSNGTRGSGRIRMFLHSHSTGHSLVRPGEDTERFTLRLPTDARKQLMDQPGPVLPQEGCSRQGYRCEGEGSSRESYFRRPDRLDWVAKSERWPFNRIPSFFVRGSPRMAADGGGRSSHCSVQQARPAI